MKVSDYIAHRLAFLGITECFGVTGGGAMHLNDSFGECPEISCWYMHHEQSAAMAAEGYARIAGKPAIVNVTTGPGAINALNGVFGAFTDSIPMVVIAGQVRTDTIASLSGIEGIRQLGDQELDSIRMVSGITKYRKLIDSPELIVECLDEAIRMATSGRPGPVWIEVPVNVQGAQIEADVTAPFDEKDIFSFQISTEFCAEILTSIANAHRPVILAGSGVRISAMQDKLVELAEVLDVPVVTAWTHDVIPSDHYLNAGRAGTIGTRPGNIVVQSADLVLVLGSRLNIRQVSYNWESFAKNAEIIWIDIDEKEFGKPYSRLARTIKADLKSALPMLVEMADKYASTHSAWLEFVGNVRKKYEVKTTDYVSTHEGINAYHVVPKVFEVAQDDAIFACGNATACIVPFQTGQLKKEMRLFSNSGSASMGYDLPAALGAAIADRNRQVICFAGDGSLMMNIQELETLRNWDCNIKVIVLDNDGYLSIKQTQQNFFGHDHGASPKSGITFPNFNKVAQAFELPSVQLQPQGDWEGQLSQAISSPGPMVVVVHLETSQEFIPWLKSRIVDGVIRTPELDDMFPHLPDEELAAIRASALEI